MNKFIEKEKKYLSDIGVKCMLKLLLTVVLSQLSRVMAEKRKGTLLQVRGLVNGIITIAVASSYSRMIRGDWLPSPLQEPEPKWDLGLGIGMAG